MWGYTAEDEGDLNSLPDVNYGCRTFEKNERIHYYRDLKDNLDAQITTLNSRKKLTATEIRLLAKRLSEEDIRKYSRFDTLATTLCDQQDALDVAQRRYHHYIVDRSL